MNPGSGEITQLLARWASGDHHAMDSLAPLVQAELRKIADAYLRGVERRIEAGLNPVIGSVASIFISRWDVAVMEKVPESLLQG